jgi:hypothetical protein
MPFIEKSALWQIYGKFMANNRQEFSAITVPKPYLNHTNTPTEYINGANAPVEKRQTFIPPSVEEVRIYCQERSNGIDAQSFVDFYSAKGWMIGKNKMKDWKAAVRTWEKSDRPNKAPPTALQT